MTTQPHPADVWVNSYQGVTEVAPTPEDAMRSRRGYYGMTSYVDDKVGDLLAELERFGMEEDTIVEPISGR